MTLFEECKEALKDDFMIIQDQLASKVMALLNNYPFVDGNVAWPEINYSDYDRIDEILHSNLIKNNEIYVVADEKSIPIFRTNFKLLAENIYDVTALSPKLFIFNKNVIVQPLFPTEIIRLGYL